MRVPRNRRKAYVAFSALLVFLASCGGTPTESSATTEAEPSATTEAEPSATTEAAEPSTTTEAAELIPVSMRLDHQPYPLHVGFYGAKEMGWYEEVGLDVSIGVGQGSSSTAQLVGAGEDDFGLVAGNIVVTAVGEGLPIKMVGGILADSGTCLMVLADNVPTPQDLVGKTIGSDPGGASTPLIEPYLTAIGIDPTTVTMQGVDNEAETTSLLEGQLDAVTSLSTLEPIELRIQQGINTDCFLFSEAGLTLIGHGIITNDTMIAEQPEVVRSFVEASVRGYQYLVDNPDDAADLFVDLIGHEVGYEQELSRATLEATVPNFTDPLGVLTEEQWLTTIDILETHLGLEDLPGPTDVYVADFYP